MIMVAHRVSVNRGAQIIHRSPYRSVLPQPLTAMRAMSVLYLFAMGPCSVDLRVLSRRWRVATSGA